MKKIFSLIFCLIFVFTVTGCYSFKIDPISTKNDTHTIECSELSSTQDIYDENSSLVSVDGDTSFPSSTPTDSSSLSKASSFSDTSSQDNVSEAPSSPPTIETDVEIITNHTPVDEKDYYQFSTLSKQEQEIYLKIVSAVKNTQNIVDIEKYSITREDVNKIVCRVSADHPEFFWLSKKYSYTYNSQRVLKIVLFYTDGTSVDDINNKLNLTHAADRQLIASQIITFNETITKIIDTIPSNISEYDKELAIFNYLSKNLEYDYLSATMEHDVDDVLPRCFDCYGAACNKLAVCEGFAKLFQYLCYSVGINATQIEGSARGGGHMWNAVKIDGVWYQTDPTWSQYSNSDDIRYDYFHLSSDEMYRKGHTPDMKYLSIPN